MPTRKNRKTMKKRPLSEWNKFVMEVKKQNPDKMFKDVLKLAGELKKKGVEYASYAKNKTQKVVEKVSKVVKNKTLGKKKKGNKGKKTGKTAKK